MQQDAVALSNSCSPAAPPDEERTMSRPPRRPSYPPALTAGPIPGPRSPSPSLPRPHSSSATRSRAWRHRASSSVTSADLLPASRVPCRNNESVAASRSLRKNEPHSATAPATPDNSPAPRLPPRQILLPCPVFVPKAYSNTQPRWSLSHATMTAAPVLHL